MDNRTEGYIEENESNNKEETNTSYKYKIHEKYARAEKLVLQDVRKSFKQYFTAVINEENIDSSLLGQEPWPSDVKLFQPYENEQMLLPDNANCLAVQAFLKMCGLKFSVECRANAEYMSPSGRVPFIKCGSYIVSDLDPIVSFVSNKGISLINDLNLAQKSDMRAYMSLVNTVLGNAENYITWLDKPTYSMITKSRYGSVHPFPLNHVLCYMKKQSVLKRLTAFKWADYSLEKVYEEVDQCCRALSDRLGKNKYFFGDKMCEVDAVVFGHIYTILTWPGLDAGLKLAEVVRSYENLLSHCEVIAPQINMGANIRLSHPHKMYCSSVGALESHTSAETNIDEFVYSDEDDSDDQIESTMSDEYVVTNDRNLMHESIFST